MGHHRPPEELQSSHTEIQQVSQDAYVCILPEQEDVEWHSDRISLFSDPNGFQDTRVSQLAAHQIVFKHTWLLNTDVFTHM